MGTRSLGIAWAVLAVGLVAAAPRPAAADAKADVQAKAKEAMEAYDLMDYDAAKKSLGQALDKAKKAKLDKDPVAAKAHLFLGIATFAGGDSDGAKSEFVIAVGIDPKIQIDAAYKSPELVKLLDAARAEAKGGSSGGSEPALNGGGDEDCGSVKGFQHAIVDSGTGGQARDIEVLVGSDLKFDRIALQYRAKSSPDYTEVKLTKKGGCKFVGQIPGAAMKGDMIYYYVAAYDSNNRIISGASKGASGAPNPIDITGGGAIKAGGGDNEDPINGTKIKKTTPPPGGDVSGGVLRGGKSPKVFVQVAGGTGFGYVTGTTEANNQVQNCCIGNSLVVITPELGYYASKQLSIGLAGRIGLPIGANVDPMNAKHSTIAPGAVVRIRYALSADGDGLRFMGQIGGGVMRNTIKLEMQPGGGDTDIVAQGPLFIGAGIGFKKSMSSSFAFILDVSALAGIAVVDKIGTARVNSGVGGDVTLGLAYGF